MVWYLPDVGSMLGCSVWAGNPVEEYGRRSNGTEAAQRCALSYGRKDVLCCDLWTCRCNAERGVILDPVGSELACSAARQDWLTHFARDVMPQFRA